MAAKKKIKAESAAANKLLAEQHRTIAEVLRHEAAAKMARARIEELNAALREAAASGGSAAW